LAAVVAAVFLMVTFVREAAGVAAFLADVDRFADGFLSATIILQIKKPEYSGSQVNTTSF
jgi:hypothetical protein